MGNERKDVACVVWAPEENRTEQFARHLDAELHNIHYLYYKRPLFAPFKYFPQAIKTFTTLRQQKPKVVFVTNPPVFAALSVAVYCWFSDCQFVMDTHSPALYSRKWSWTVPLQRFLAKHAVVNIVDQERYEELFESWGGRALVLEKPLAEDVLDGKLEGPAPGTFTVTVINTFAVDEPLEPIYDAARLVPDVCFVVLGDTALAERGLLERAPENVTFSGYLYNNDYWRQLDRSNAVLALTTYPYSLLAGGHDGLALHKPLILSKQPALVDFFTSGTQFVEHTGESIAEAVQNVQENEDRFIQQMEQLKEEKLDLWSQNFARLDELIADICD